MKLKHFFIPHPETHKAAHLISTPAFLIYILLFLALQFGFKDLSIIRPDILGISANIEVKELIRLTNQQREKNGLSPLTENSLLNQAAGEKAKNMFAENYWAHYSPSGRDPWSFILGAGYKFSYAGENLARNFHTSQEVVDAWMASPSHKENIINPHYTDIGMAVSFGKINGQDTVLIVQEFGSPVEFIAKANPTTAPIANVQAPLPSLSPGLTAQPSLSPTPSSTPLVVGVAKEQPPVTPPVLIDSFQLGKTISLSLLSFIGLLLVVDLVILRKRAVARVSSRHWSHLALLAVTASVIASSSGGSIL